MRCARRAAICPRATCACTSASERPHTWRVLSSTGPRDWSRSFWLFPPIAKTRSGKEQARPSPRRRENSVRLLKMAFLRYAGKARKLFWEEPEKERFLDRVPKKSPGPPPHRGKNWSFFRNLSFSPDSRFRSVLDLPRRALPLWLRKSLFN